MELSSYKINKLKIFTVNNLEISPVFWHKTESIEANSFKLLGSDMVRLDMPLDNISLAFAFKLRKPSLSNRTQLILNQ
jgi:hypothetical protein